MSNMPLVPPILPLPDDSVNAPEPESENADKQKAERAEKLIDGDDLLDPDEAPREGVFGTKDDPVENDIEAAKKRIGKD